MSIGVRIFTAAALTAALLASPAFAQFKKDEPKSLLQIEEEEHKKRNAEIDKEYDTMRKRSKSDAAAPSTKTDPWANMRSSGDTAKR